MADIYFNGKRINDVTHIGYDPAAPNGDKSAVTIKKKDGTVIFYDEAHTISEEELELYRKRFKAGVGTITGISTSWFDTIKFERNKSTMKEKLLIVLVLILAVAGIGYAAVHHHNQQVYAHQQYEARLEAQAVAKHNAEVAAQKAAAEKAAALAAQEAAQKAAEAKSAKTTSSVKTSTVQP